METLKEAFYAKYPYNRKILAYFEEANGCECTWENITKVRLQKYVTYLRERLAPNSVKTYCSRLKTVLNLYSEEVVLPRDTSKMLQIKKDACQHVYLNDEELKRIIAYHPTSFIERVVRNWFLVGCFTGARHSDYIRFTASNIRDGQLHYVSIKTHISASVPVSPILAKLIEDAERNEYSKVTITDVYFNRIVKRICLKAGITDNVSVYMRGKFNEGPKWKFVASHTARRSFATNLYKKGVDLHTISKLCGHSSVEMTETYICCGIIINDSVMDYFNTFGDTE